MFARRGNDAPRRLNGLPLFGGHCNICGLHAEFFCSEDVVRSASFRESLVCSECLATSRYRSIARGLLRAVKELAGVSARSIAELAAQDSDTPLNIYDTQTPFYDGGSAYPIPDLLSPCSWIDVQTSMYKSRTPFGGRLGPGVTNQNLEALSFPDRSFDIVVTSDVMEHVRLDGRAHREIQRILKTGGVYLFTVPHIRSQRDNFTWVEVTDPSDPSKDKMLREEYHLDGNSEGGRALSYRSYGTGLDSALQELGFSVEYTREDFRSCGIVNTELFYCRLSRPGDVE